MIQKIINYILSLLHIKGANTMTEEQFLELLRRLEELNAKVDDVAKKSYDKGFEDGKLQGFEEGKVAGFDEGYAKGKEDGLKECPTSDKIYSQEEMDAAVNPLKEQVASQEAKIAEQEIVIAAQGEKIAELEAKVGEIDQKVAEAISNFKATVREHLADVNQDLA